MAEAWDFLDGENWTGGFYELALKLGPRDAPDSTDRVSSALSVVGGCPEIDGCFRDRWIDPSSQTRTDAVPRDLEHPEPFYGFMDLAGRGRVVCATHVVREEGDDGSDWVDLCIPLGALARSDGRVGAYPFGNEEVSRAWREPLDEQLISVVQEVGRRQSIELALIGFEVSGNDDQILATDPDQDWATVVLPSPGGLKVLKPSSWHEQGG